MSFKVGDVPVPGYRLEAFLGAGSYGEVWRATGPGDVPCALKVLRLDNQSGLKELRAIGLVKRLQHPNLCPVQAIWLRDDDGKVIGEVGTGLPVSLRPEGGKELVIAMGLGQKTLLQRLEETRDAAGGAGLPPKELLRYLEDAARGIDFLNDPVHDLGDGPVPIVHCDIKPANLLIVGGGVQVCDYGVAKALSKDVRKTFAAGTPAYAAPELINNEPSATTDQYALAITYFELRTGVLPFEEARALAANLTGQLDLSRLPPDEQGVIRRATSLRSEDRYPTCMEMVEELETALGVSISTTDLARAKGLAAPRRQAEPAVAVQTRPATTQADQRQTAPAHTRTPVEPTESRAANPTVASRRSGRRRGVAVAIGIVAVLGAGVAFFASQSGTRPAPRAPVDPLTEARELLNRPDPEIEAGRDKLRKVPANHEDSLIAIALNDAWGKALLAKTLAAAPVGSSRDLVNFVEDNSFTPAAGSDEDRDAVAKFLRRQITARVRTAILGPTPRDLSGWRDWRAACGRADGDDPLVAAVRAECWAELKVVAATDDGPPAVPVGTLAPDDPLAGYPAYVAARCQHVQGFAATTPGRAAAAAVKKFLPVGGATRPAWLNEDREARVHELLAAAK